MLRWLQDIMSRFLSRTESVCKWGELNWMVIIMERRFFFKQAARRTLPIVGLILFSETSMGGIIQPNNCKNECSHNCNITCQARCQGACYEDPCGGTCANKCTNACTRSCFDGCTRGCGASCFGACSGSSQNLASDTTSTELTKTDTVKKK